MNKGSKGRTERAGAAGSDFLEESRDWGHNPELQTSRPGETHKSESQVQCGCERSSREHLLLQTPTLQFF